MSITFATVTRVPATAQALETCLRIRRLAVSALLSLDGEDRWGRPGPERLDEMAKETAQLNEQISRAETAMNQQVETLRREDPGALESWISAHEMLLEAYLQQLAQHPEPERVGTETYVAQQERALWAQVRAGEMAYVNQNSFYVRPPRELYVQLFGVEFWQHDDSGT